LKFEKQRIFKVFWLGGGGGAGGGDKRDFKELWWLWVRVGLGWVVMVMMLVVVGCGGSWVLLGVAWSVFGDR